MTAAEAKRAGHEAGPLGGAAIARVLVLCMRGGIERVLAGGG